MREGATVDELARLADLIHERNENEVGISAIIGRPAQLGHVGEYIASRIFEIELNVSASEKGFDGRFSTGPLRGQTVDIKWYPKNESILAINPQSIPDYYLVLTGPRTAPATSRQGVRPWRISAVYLFEGRQLVQELEDRSVSLSVATSVKKEYWDAAEIYPEQRNNELVLSEEQHGSLRLFGS